MNKREEYTMSIFDAIGLIATAVSESVKESRQKEKEQEERAARKERVYESAVNDVKDRTYTQHEAMEMLERINNHNKRYYRKIHPYIEITHTPVEIEEYPTKFISPEVGYTGNTPEEYVSGGYNITLRISGGDYIELTKYERPE